MDYGILNKLHLIIICKKGKIIVAFEFSHFHDLFLSLFVGFIFLTIFYVCFFLSFDFSFRTYPLYIFVFGNTFAERKGMYNITILTIVNSKL